MKITARSLFEIAGLKIPESFDVVENEVKSVAAFIRENCSDYLWMFTDPNPTLLYAGSHKRPSQFVVQHPKPRQRSHYVNSWLDVSPKPAGMPRRAWGVYATPDKDYAANFGTVSVIVPFNGAKIAATSAPDFAAIESIWPVSKPLSSGFTDDSWLSAITTLAIVSKMRSEEVDDLDKWSALSDRLEADPKFAASIHDKLVEFNPTFDWWMSDVVPHIERGFLETVLNRVFRYDNMSDPYTVLTTKTLRTSHPGGETVIEGSVVRLSEEMYEMVVEFLTDSKVA